MPLNFDTPQYAKLFDLEYEIQHPPVNILTVQQYAVGDFAGKYLTMVSAEADGIYITKGTLNGWVSASRIVIATPRIGGVSGGVITNLSISVDSTGRWIAGFSFDIPDKIDPESFYFIEGDPIETSLGYIKNMRVYKPYSLLDNVFKIFTLENDGIHERSESDAFISSTKVFTINGASGFRIYSNIKYRTQIEITS